MVFEFVIFSFTLRVVAVVFHDARPGRRSFALVRIKIPVLFLIVVVVLVVVFPVHFYFLLFYHLVLPFPRVVVFTSRAAAPSRSPRRVLLQFVSHSDSFGNPRRVRVFASFSSVSSFSLSFLLFLRRRLRLRLRGLLVLRVAEKRVVLLLRRDERRTARRIRASSSTIKHHHIVLILKLASFPNIVMLMLMLMMLEKVLLHILYYLRHRVRVRHTSGIFFFLRERV